MMLAIAIAAFTAVPAAPSCQPAQLSVKTGGNPGDFNGMSHSGTLLIVTNRSGRACSVPGLPTVVFRDARGRRLDIMRQVPVGMHPGPVIVPITMAAGASISTPLRWISGEVYEHSSCLMPATVEVTIAGRPVRTRLTARICGEVGKSATFEQPVLHAGAA